MKRISKDKYYLDIALAVSKRSTCLKRHYGCVIVKDDTIIATGYNGSPRGSENCCDKNYCPRMNIEHNFGNYQNCPAVHAEQNALISSERNKLIGSTLYLIGEENKNANDFSFTDTKIIEDAIPCPICFAMIKNAGVSKIVNMKNYDNN